MSSVHTVDGKANKTSRVSLFRTFLTNPALRSVGTVDARIPAANSAFSLSFSVRFDDVNTELVVERGVLAVFADCIECVAP